MTAVPAFDQLDTVTLADLAGVELLVRVDRKYALTREDAQGVLRDLDPATRVLRIGAQATFGYRSTYFDTPDLLSYRLAAHTRRRRFKVRTRTYVDSALTFLEVKTRGLRDVTTKDRMEYTAPGRLDDDARRYATDTLAPLGLDRSVTASLRPVLRTEYDRVTLAPPGSGVRVTVDSGLAWSDMQGRHRRLPDLVVIETKSSGRPSDVDRLLWRHGHRPDAISKYGTGLAALRGDLPDNKWTRVLRRHFPIDAPQERP